MLIGHLCIGGSEKLRMLNRIEEAVSPRRRGSELIRISPVALDRPATRNSTPIEAPAPPGFKALLKSAGRSLACSIVARPWSGGINYTNIGLFCDNCNCPARGNQVGSGTSRGWPEGWGNTQRGVMDSLGHTGWPAGKHFQYLFWTLRGG